jgi:hypothetical protein
MTQITQEQREQQVRAAGGRVAEKLKCFYEGLPSDEQLVLDAALRQSLNGGTDADAKGFARSQGPGFGSVVGGYLIGKAVDFVIENIGDFMTAYGETEERARGMGWPGGRAGSY